MPRTVLVAPDKFKGTLTAAQAADAIASGWRCARGDDRIELLPITDGGDGFGEIVSGLLHGAPQTTKAVDAAHRPCNVTWWWHEQSRTAVIESARVIGLAQLPPGKYHPFELDTRGLGELLLAIAAKGARECLIGIGGSATNDGGFGMADALGWQFFNDHDQKITRWTELHSLAQIRPPDKQPLFDHVTVAVDVQNPLLGQQGCTRIYGPQKGLKPEDFEFAERCLEQISVILSKELHLNCAEEPGAGAAGGLGYGSRCFLGAKLEPGFNLFARYANLARRLGNVDLVITGEGAIDSSSLMGKGVGELATLCKRLHVPCIGIGGVVTSGDAFTKTYSLTPAFVSQEEAFANPATHLEALAAKAAHEL
ncbi:MAG TPA: glycerate kinase [Candidatus Binatia bacterium]|nr:glycerate kinase [Candidatus Binatia bacterium]